MQRRHAVEGGVWEEREQEEGGTCKSRPEALLLMCWRSDSAHGLQKREQHGRKEVLRAQARWWAWGRRGGAEDGRVLYKYRAELSC